MTDSLSWPSVHDLALWQASNQQAYPWLVSRFASDGLDPIPDFSLVTIDSTAGLHLSFAVEEWSAVELYFIWYIHVIYVYLGDSACFLFLSFFLSVGWILSRIISFGDKEDFQRWKKIIVTRRFYKDWKIVRRND